VLDFALNKLKVKGRIGVYGRSIGGIAANHLAGKFTDIVDMLIIDRSMSDLKVVVEKKMRGPATKIIYNMISCYWKTPNAKEFVNSPSFKIITSDPLDDTVDLFANLHVGVAEECSKKDYFSPVYSKLFESLIFIYQ